ncbi:hypothetical protein [Enterovibrio paralichthyis]|uniref:hypothetical protein n=1 Tax=Enterovibrio paralichthyis TaxID=2853805 RepID=UPI001C4565B5|nr:hypothetical protein [Enterovibrio paralichthyis]MBV7299150.1 hypothetical protein [Enterovibrio paralichthyis]
MSGKDVEKANRLAVYVLSCGDKEQTLALLESYIRIDLNSLKLYDYMEYIDALSIAAYVMKEQKDEKKMCSYIDLLKQYYEKEEADYEDRYCEEVSYGYFSLMAASCSDLLEIREHTVSQQAECLAYNAIGFIKY